MIRINHVKGSCQHDKQYTKLGCGLGTIRIRIFNGDVRTITEVRPMPDLARNMISLGTLDGRGYRYSSQGGAVKASKGAVVERRNACWLV